jgi:hypothetical protein
MIQAANQFFVTKQSISDFMVQISVHPAAEVKPKRKATNLTGVLEAVNRAQYYFENWVEPD